MTLAFTNHLSFSHYIHQFSEHKAHSYPITVNWGYNFVGGYNGKNNYFQEKTGTSIFHRKLFCDVPRSSFLLADNERIYASLWGIQFYNAWWNQLLLIVGIDISSYKY